MGGVRKGLAKGSQRAGFVVVAVIVLIAALAIPVGLSDVRNTLLRRASLDDYHLLFASDALRDGLDPSQENIGYFETQITGLNDTEQTLTLRVTGVQQCLTDCGYKERVIFYSLASATVPDEYPEFAAFTLSPNVATTETLKLPYRSDIYRYPFDANPLILGVAVERIRPDNTATRLPADQVRREFLFLLRDIAPRTMMAALVSHDPAAVRPPNTTNVEYAYVGATTLERPLHLRVIIAFILLLMTVLVAYIVLLRPFDTIVGGVAGLVLGTWGLRGIILGGIPGDFTFIDLYLLGLIFFVLLVTIARGLNVLHLGGELRVPGFAVKKMEDTRSCPECESDIPKTAHRCRFCTAYVTPEIVAPPADVSAPPPGIAAPLFVPPPAPPFAVPSAPPSAPPGVPPGTPRFSR